MGEQKYDDKPMEKGGENDCSGGPVKKRGCTDIFCCIFFLAHWVVFLGLAGMSLSDGNPARLIAMRDHKGAHCGIEEQWNPWNTDRKTRPYNLKDFEKAAFLMNVHTVVGDMAKSVACRMAQSTGNSVYDAVACSALGSEAGIQEKMQQLTDPAFIAASLTGGSPSMMEQIGVYFHKSCVKSCEEVQAFSASAANNNPAVPPAGDNPESQSVDIVMTDPLRTYQYVPPVDEPWYPIGHWAASQGYLGMFKFPALPASICPEDPMYCVPFPGMKFADVANMCIFSLDTGALTGVTDAMSGVTDNAAAGAVTENLGTAIGDIQTAWPAFIIVAFLSLAVGFTFMILLKFCVGVIVWTSIGLVFALIFGAGAYGFWKASCETKTATVTATAPAPSTGTATTTVAGNSTLLRELGEVENWDTMASAAVRVLGSHLNATTVAPTTAAPASGTAAPTTSSSEYEECEEPDEDTRNMYLYMSYVMFGFAALYALMILCMCSRIRLGIAINKVAATFVWQTKTILLCPVVQIGVALVWWIIWIFIAMHMTSQFTDETLPSGPFTRLEALGDASTPGECNGAWPAGDAYVDESIVYTTVGDGSATNADSNNIGRSNIIADNECTANRKCFRCTLPSVMIDPTAKPFPRGASFFYAFFSLLWNNAFIIAVGQCTIAGSVAYWYFTPNDKKGSTACVRPALYNCFRYHLGSLAFGSFILAVVQFIKWIMYYIQKQAEAQKNPVLAKVAMAIQCCIRCFERLIKFLNKNAYIQIAILGKSFCKSAWNAFCLILRNAARIGILGMIGGMVSKIGVVFISVATAAIGYFILIAMYEDDISSPWVCSFMFLIMGYVNAKLFMNVFGLAVDSTLQCFCADEELHSSGGGGGAQYTPEQLKGFLKDPNKKSKCGCC